jgi:60 kDa SS-A/Ro ribonucleoprotein
MAIKTLFQSFRGKLIPPATVQNHELAPAFSLAPKQALAQYGATGCFGRTFYATAGEQLADILALAAEVPPEFAAKVAIYSRTQAHLKDVPALLCAWLSARVPRLHEAVFARVIDNARMLRTYVQIVRSGVVGRKSLGTAPKRLIREWLAAHDEEALFRSSAGQSPSLADILKLVHPKPAGAEREAFYAWLLGRPYRAEALPALVAQWERFRKAESLDVPDVPFTLLSALPLSRADWAAIAGNASWQTTRMNLNTFARHGVFEVDGMSARIADRLRDREAIARARVFPYQLLAAWQNTDPAVPGAVREALQDAMEIATTSVPAIPGRVVVCPDISGSMLAPVTGYRKGASSAVRCVDVAALVAACVLRTNPDSTVLPFNGDVVTLRLNPRDSVMTNAALLAARGGGGTNCSAPLQMLNRRNARADLVLFVSDNESWADPRVARGTAMMAEWAAFRARNPQARLVCLDVQPNKTTQAAERADVLNIGGFSDRVFDVIQAFASDALEAGHWVARIEAVAI